MSQCAIHRSSLRGTDALLDALAQVLVHVPEVPEGALEDGLGHPREQRSHDVADEPVSCGVIHHLADQLAGGQRGVVGVMLESFLVAGRQDPGDPATLTYGQSVTDACMDIEMTRSALETLATSVQARRRSSSV